MVKVNCQKVLEIEGNKVALKQWIKSREMVQQEAENEILKHPYIKEDGTLVIPFDSDPKYHWWKGGQSVRETLKELGASEEVLNKYISKLNK